MSLPARNMFAMTQVPWLKIAYGEYQHHVGRLGTVDARGNHIHAAGTPHDNPRIMEYLRAAGAKKSLLNEDTSWCSAFVNWCMRRAGLIGTHSTMARSWLHWHHGEKLSQPIPGAIVVFPRGKDPTYGHVAFVWEVKGANYLSILGGNQGQHKAVLKTHKPGESSHVSIATRHEAPLGILWPKGFPYPIV
jgi:uncharacterized protein (TIGR02594 family)